MDSRFEPLHDDEVLHVTRGRILMANPTFRISEFLDALAQMVSEQEEVWTEDSEGWFFEGTDCEALRPGNQGWQRGRVRIRLEFMPAPPPKLLKASPRNRLEGRPEPRTRREEPPAPKEDVYRPYGREDVFAREDDFYGDDY